MCLLKMVFNTIVVFDILLWKDACVCDSKVKKLLGGKLFMQQMVSLTKPW